MRIRVIGAVAAGTSAAAKARRNMDMADIVIYEMDTHISYSGCGLPYFIGDEIKDDSELAPRDPAFFKKKYNIDVKTRHEVMSVDAEAKSLRVKNMDTDEVFIDTYDELVIATGAKAFIPPIKGTDMDHVFTLRNVGDAINIKNFIENKRPKKAVVAGTGFIGFEVLENLIEQGIEVEVVELMDKITPNLDRDMAIYLSNELKAKGLEVKTSTAISEILKEKVSLSTGEELEADMVVLATGVRPNVTLAKEIGLKIGDLGGILVDHQMKTSQPHIYACGDCIETYDTLTGKNVYRPLGSTANKTGRIAGDVMTGGSLTYKGNLGTSIFKLFDLAVGMTGLSEKTARQEGYDIEIIHNIKPDRPLYYHGKNMVIKAIADRESKKLLGVQAIGYNGVDKRIDVFATLITYGATVDELFHLDLAYAPPFSTTKDPVHYTGMILDNAINTNRKIITSEELKHYDGEVQIIDARTNKDFVNKGSVDGAVNMPHASLREQMESLDKDKMTVTFCNKGVTGNAAQNILINHGFKNVKNLSGGHTFYKGSR